MRINFEKYTFNLVSPHQFVMKYTLTKLWLVKKYGKFSNKSIEWLFWIIFLRYPDVVASFDLMTSIFAAFTIDSFIDCLC